MNGSESRVQTLIPSWKSDTFCFPPKTVAELAADWHCLIRNANSQPRENSSMFFFVISSILRRVQLNSSVDYTSLQCLQYTDHIACYKTSAPATVHRIYRSHSDAHGCSDVTQSSRAETGSQAQLELTWSCNLSNDRSRNGPMKPQENK